MKQLVVILITALTLSIAGTLYAIYNENEWKETAITEYVHMGQLYQPMPEFVLW